MEQEKKKKDKKAAKEKQKHEKTAEKQEATLRRKLKKELKEKKRVAAVSARFVWTDGVTMELLEMSKETKDEHDNQDASMTGYKIW
ncbi:hypothetical protein DD238_003082 [Peronospora effusa]|uniref:Uncharacterized protein n=1 Tax=Peronospora effusa TaxID=542832 RepID=A0A3M6VLV8_9STRA|nr:hypothetical protein DD238_003082 [Peronospora effusa]